MSALAEMERAIIAERQKDVHRDRREKGKVWGVDLGLKTKVPAEVRSQISEYRSLGMSYNKIAEKLNNEKIPPTRGAKWYASTVHSLVNNLKDKGSSS
jgi:DNA invertase Pin-like site-specific DNA recombinase